jgi:methionine-rich copper-binding protein CopC
MGKKDEKVTISQDFAFNSDADLSAQIAAFQTKQQETQALRLAMDARRSLGPGKVRVTFRVVSNKRR